MSDAVLTFLLENLTQLLVNEAELFSGVKDELKSLEAQLVLMRSFLASCEGVRQDYPVVDELVNQIRDLACDAEDVIDDYVAYAMEQRRKRGIAKIFSLSKYLNKRDIRKRAKDIKKTMEEIIANKATYGIEIKQASKEDSAEGYSSRRRIRRPPNVEEDDVVGFINDAKALVNRLVGGELKRAVIPIVGMGGLGKTTIAKKIYRDVLVKKSFASRAWVYVSQQNTSQQLRLGILRSLKKLTEEMKDMSEDDLGQLLGQLLEGNKYLIVMDDVWESRVWEDLKPFLPDNKNGSRILLTSRSSEVASSAISPSPKSSIHNLRFLDKEESWELFRKKAFRGENCSHRWEELGRQIAENCRGLPLAIVVLGSLLAEKSRYTFDEWSKVATRVSTYLSQRSSECKDILALSYDVLPSHLKPCFLYFGVFPEDHEIPAQQVIHLWIAEGLIEPENGETLEEIGERYLETLTDRSLIQVLQRRSDRGVKTCSIHDLLRDLCISESQSSKFLQFHGSLNSPFPTKPRRLSGNNKTIAYISKNTLSVGRLRSLLCFMPGSAARTDWADLFSRMRLLRVFKVADVAVVPEEIENIMYLRYLGLDAKTFIRNPSSICTPRLQILDARSKFLQKLPVEFWKMKKLRHVYLQSTCLPQPSSPLDSSLENLQTLSTICPSSCTRPVFENLPNLMKLGVKGDLSKHSENLSQNFAILENLRTLKLVRMTEFPALVSLPHKLPANLSQLTLCNTRLEEDPMQLLGNLQNLQILKFVNCAYTGGKMVSAANAFPCLQFLKFVNVWILELKVETGSLPSLDNLVIHDCYAFERLTGMSNLISLKLLDVWNPAYKLRQQVKEFEKDHCQIHVYQTHVNPRVFFDVTIEGNHEGSIVVELFKNIAPQTAEKFRSNCTGENKFSSWRPHKDKPRRWLHDIYFSLVLNEQDNSIRVGDQINGGNFSLENSKLSHIGPGVLSVRYDPIVAGAWEYRIHTKEEPSLDGKDLVFGKVIDGYNIVEAMVKYNQQMHTYCSADIIDCGELKET